MKPLDVLLAISVPMIWGGGFLFAKVAIDHFPPILLMTFRFGLAALVLVWFVPRPDNATLRRLFWITVISASIQYSMTFTGLKGLDASTAIIIVQLEVPFAVLCASVFLKDRLGLKHIIGIGLAFLGVLLIAGEPTLDNNLSSILLVVAGAATWAVGQVMVKALGQLGGFVLIAWVAVLATPQLLLSSLLFEQDHLGAIRNADAVVWAAVVYLGLIMTALGYAVWYHLIGKYPVNLVMPFLLLLPVATVAGGVLILDEVLTTRVAVGGVLAIAGVAIINLVKSPPDTQT